MTTFSQLSDVLLCELLCRWIGTKDLGKFDVSMTRKLCRENYLDVLHSTGFVLNCRKYLNVLLSKWLNSRRISLSHMCLNDQSLSDDCLLQYDIQYRKQIVHLKYSGIDEDSMFLDIINLLPNLTYVEWSNYKFVKMFPLIKNPNIAQKLTHIDWLEDKDFQIVSSYCRSLNTINCICLLLLDDRFINDFANILKNCPNIESLSFSDCNVEYIKLIAIIRSDIKTLKIRGAHTEYFDSVLDAFQVSHVCFASTDNRSEVQVSLTNMSGIKMITVKYHHQSFLRMPLFLMRSIRNSFVQCITEITINDSFDTLTLRDITDSLVMLPRIKVVHFIEVSLAFDIRKVFNTLRHYGIMERDLTVYVRDDCYLFNNYYHEDDEQMTEQQSDDAVDGSTGTANTQSVKSRIQKI